MSQVPSVTARTTTASASSWETAKRLFSLFVDRRCLAGAAFTQDDECHKALPIYVATASLALLVILFCVCCCCCCHRDSRGRTSSRRLRSPLAGRMMRGPDFPDPPSYKVTVSIPDGCSPGQPFQFRHPNTEQLMEAKAPLDGSRLVQVQTVA
eukprot:CAMPEP_0172676950 /NCGR_PEP_ID=MMETSP1074-20121228/14339_1 /TAXON_ID=2916 /ORGANISM="Ceratium fusus, Strain PA161109" /LENGTH=152 /DNA_ID=CAMNT_0013494711 /DNA_START=621 /DNA_END=1079 /DNA_ORIENTATION=-